MIDRLRRNTKTKTKKLVRFFLRPHPSHQNEISEFESERASERVWKSKVAKRKRRERRKEGNAGTRERSPERRVKRLTECLMVDAMVHARTHGLMMAAPNETGLTWVGRSVGRGSVPSFARGKKLPMRKEKEGRIGRV